jgi:pilus assembly protein CpaF
MSLLRRIEQAQQGAEPSRPGVPTRTPQAPIRGPQAPARNPLAPTLPTRALGGTREDYLGNIRQRMLDQIMQDHTLLSSVDKAHLKAKVTELVDQVIAVNGFAIRHEERLALVDDLMAEIGGFGPIEPLLHDETITEVMVNGPRQVYIERRGKLELTNVVFRNEDHVMHVIDRIIAPLGRRVDESSPRVDARLPDGSRVNAIIPPLSLIGPVITIRKFATKPYTVDDLVRFGTATPDMFDFLQACVEARLNIFVSGGTGSGKTTFLNVLSSFIPNDERIVTIEDAAELQLHQEHVITLESRPPNLEGEGEIPIRLLLRNALHMRPDRIIVGECRGGEALDMLQAMNCGHDGSLSTGHSNSPRDMLSRLETMVLMSGWELPLRSIREQVASAIDLIVHTARLKDGSRKVVNITEVYGIEDDEVQTQDIFVFEQTGVEDGKIQGRLKPTGIRPTFMGKFRELGVALPAGEFGIPPEDPAHPDKSRSGKARFSGGEGLSRLDESLLRTRAVKAGGMVYISSVGPIDPETKQVIRGGIKEQTAQCLRNIQAALEGLGSSLDRVVWANWSLRDPAEFEAFNKEWTRAFAGEVPVGQQTMMPPLQRRAGFRISIGVIAQA